MSNENKNGASSGNGASATTAARPAVSLIDNRYASPADILHAMLASGWSWYELAAGAKHPKLSIVSVCKLVVLTRDGFEYVVQPECITWQTITTLHQEYGFYIGKCYMEQLGVRDSLDSVQ